ncbi:MAG: hypothetical protein AAF202_00115 [Pseudomonadota bacterium]
MISFLRFVVLYVVMGASLAHAQGFFCSTSPASTSYSLRANSEGNFELMVIHHLGVQHAPLLNGITTGYTLNIVEDRFTYAKKMGERFKVKFPKEKCRFRENMVTCSLSKESKIGELDVDGFSLIAYKENSSSPIGDFVEIRVRFDYRVKGWPHEMSMEFSDLDCRGQVFR